MRVQTHTLVRGLGQVQDAVQQLHLVLGVEQLDALEKACGVSGSGQSDAALPRHPLHADSLVGMYLRRPAWQWAMPRHDQALRVIKTRQSGTPWREVATA